MRTECGRREGVRWWRLEHLVHDDALCRGRTSRPGTGRAVLAVLKVVSCLDREAASWGIGTYR
jgi:hypothetical protein